MNREQSVLVLGANGMVGAAITRALEAQHFSNILKPGRDELDLMQQDAVRQYFSVQRPQLVFMAAAKVGGILANDSLPVDFLYQNTLMAMHAIHAAWENGVEKLLFLGSTCIYPRLAEQPLKESALLSGPLEPTNEWYAIAKIAGIKLCDAMRKQYGCNFISAMPTNLYGPHDNYDLQTAHVLPALIRRFHEAKINGSELVTLWGSGQPRREFLHVDDCASACLHLMAHHNEAGVINIGCGEDIAIKALAALVAEIVGYRGAISYDTDKPDGTPRKLVDIQRIRALGWAPEIGLQAGIRETYAWYLSEVAA